MSGAAAKPRIDGKFLQVAGDRFLVKGVAYGTFAPDERGHQFPPPAQMAADFAQMRSLHINTIRTYTAPSAALLDQAQAHGLRVIAGLAWPQHVAFLDDRRLCREIRRTVRDEVRRTMTHPAALMVTVGNEIPPGIVRWHGARRVEAFLRSLLHEAKSAVPDALVAYINFPPTEYLDTEAFDVFGMNVYLHREQDLRAYIARLQHVAGNRPLLMTEMGADSLREGEEGQAALTTMQLRCAFAGGAAGAVAFTWTDEWWRGGSAVTDWAFGLVDDKRRPKLAADAVSRCYLSAPFPEPLQRRWPKVSVLICAYNAAATLDDCLTSLSRLTYPDYEVVVIDDGSRDDTALIASRYPVKLVRVPNGGLSAARNLAAHHATGEIVAYTDSDARVDPDWLTFLVQPFLNSDVQVSGGLNVVPPDDPWLAHCVARSPGGPTHVLLDDVTAEHVPGVNMAFRRDALLRLHGFNPVYHAAGDDVDLCWRFQAAGMRLGFAPAAWVWHHHRPSIRAYWRQQAGYGEAEVSLMRHHPEKFLDGQARWVGRIYSALPILRSMGRVRVNSGVWGTAPFPSIYTRQWQRLAFWPHTGQWQLVSLLCAWSGIAGVIFEIEFLGALALLGILGLMITAGRCIRHGLRSDLRDVPRVGTLTPALSRLVYRVTIAWLHFLQPLAREWGRLRGRFWPPSAPAAEEPEPGHAPAAKPLELLRAARLLVTGRVLALFWSETWLDRIAWLTRLAALMRRSGAGRSVDTDDGWHLHDIAVMVGRWASLNLHTVVEEHERGRSLLRIATVLHLTTAGKAFVLGPAAALGAALWWRMPLMAMVAAALTAVAASRLLFQVAKVDAAIQYQLTRASLEFGLWRMAEQPRPVPLQSHADVVAAEDTVSL